VIRDWDRWRDVVNSLESSDSVERGECLDQARAFQERLYCMQFVGITLGLGGNCQYS
jgi:hypothetical protein